MGSQVFWYSLQPGSLLLAWSVFDGVRVHGIHARTLHTTTASPAPSLQEEKTARPSALLAVFGEKRVKVLELSGDAVATSKGGTAEAKLLQVLPRFSSWVFDARFIGLESDPEGGLAVGLGNNSVSLWDWRTRVELRRVQCSVECLLYSMALHGDTVAQLAVVAGTIYNEVLIWKTHALEDSLCECQSAPLCGLSLSRVEPLHTLRGHEGSIHRVSWALDGSKVMSVSDDRSARIWNAGTGGSASKASAGPILYGHSARIWDCILTDRFIVTASEDCTCRVWTPDGQLASVVQGHAGRGVWRALFEPSLCALVTGGADSAVKMHPMRDVVGRLTVGGLERVSREEENFVLRNGPANLRKRAASKKEMTSKSEYVRCLAVVGPDCFYVATNQGYLYRVNLEGEDDTWHPLIGPETEPGGPIVSLAVRLRVRSLDEEHGRVDQERMPRDDANEATDYPASAERMSTSGMASRDRRQEHCVLWGNYLGRATAAYFDCGKRQCSEGEDFFSVLPKAAGSEGEDFQSARKLSGRSSLSSYSLEELGAGSIGKSNRKNQKSGPGGMLELRRCQWQAHEARKLLGVFWADALGHEHAFTTDAVGRVSWWRVDGTREGTRGSRATLLGAFQSPFWVRVLSLTVDDERQNLLCGDQKGNLVAFSLSAGDHNAPDLPLTGALKAAHGISAIPMVAVDPDGPQDRTVTTVGRDGCICTHLLQPRPQLMTSGQASADLKENEPKLSNRDEAAMPGKCLVRLNEQHSKAEHLLSDGSRLEGRAEEAIKTAILGKPSVWLTCTKVERVSCMPSIEWTGFSGTEYSPSLNRDHLAVGQLSDNLRRLAAGFSSTEFVVWDLEQQSEVVRVTCGGWHRPHSFWIGRPNESGVKSCFAFVKNDELHVHRKGCLEQGSCSEVADSTVCDQFSTKGGLLRATKVLHPVFHGKELHCAQFLPAPKDWDSCVLTGGEDGIVRMTRFGGPNHCPNFSSDALGEHVRGAAIRACAIVPSSEFRAAEKSVEELEAGEAGPCVVFTAGAKEVLTAWLHAWEPKTGPRAKAPSLKDAMHNGITEMSLAGARRGFSNGSSSGKGDSLIGTVEGLSVSEEEQAKETSCSLVEQENERLTDLPAENDMQEREWGHSWRWLSTHDGSTEALESRIRTGSETSTSKAGPGRKAGDKDDQRYLAVTAFSTGAFKGGNLICFVVTASADSKVVLRAFHPHSRTWHVLAHLEHHTCPVLSLDCLTVPLTQASLTSQESQGPLDLDDHAFLVLSGATDGSIAFWNVTGPVQSFKATWQEWVAAVSDQEGNSRPPTGRGSAGGGGWRRLSGPRMSKRSKTKLAKAAASHQSQEKAESVGVDTAVAESDETSEAHLQDGSGAEGHVPRQVDEERGAGTFTQVEAASGDQVSGLISPVVNHVTSKDHQKGGAEGSTSGEANPSTLERTSRSLPEASRKSTDGRVSIVTSLAPLHVIEAAHQSGVNSLSVAAAKEIAETADVSKAQGRKYVVVSGGDDQAIHTAHFRVEMNGQDELVLALAARGSVQLAHSSAVKDIWTDGSYAFSTGLDQRLRCWRLLQPPPQTQSTEEPPRAESMGKARAPLAKCSADSLLQEVSECVTDVPEAAALSVQKRARTTYSVVVGGRGIQLISMHAPYVEGAKSSLPGTNIH